MCHVKLVAAVSAVALSLSAASTSRAVYTYNFNNLTGSAAPGTPLVVGTTLGTVGQDNWVLASGVSSNVRSDPPSGFTGNFLQGAPADATLGNDSIETRVDGAFGSLGLGGQRYITLQFDGLVGLAGYNNTGGNPVSRRSEIAPAVDANLDGDIRGTSSATENGEVGPQFGYESTGTGWYVRRAAYSNTGTVTALTTAQGVWRMQLVIDLQSANVSTVADAVHGGFVNDGAGTLYVKQLSDANGNPVNDVFRLASATTANVNMGLSGMGGLGGADPINWNGLNTRTAQNGGIDNIMFMNGLPTTTSTWVADAGDWLNSGNWYIGVPNGVDAVAELSFGSRTNSTVYADTNITLGTLNIGNTFSYNLSGNGSLTMQKTTGNAGINLTQGTQKINLPLVIASNTVLNTTAGTTLKISDPVTVNSGQSITQTGAGTVVYESTINVLSSGAIALRGPQHIAGLTLGSNANASLSAAPATTFSVVQADSLSLAAGSKIDFGTNELVAPGTTADAKARIVSAQYFTSASALGRGLGYGDVGGGKVRVLYTVLGDATLDRTVGFNDLVSLAQKYNLATGAVWTEGDFNYDGAVGFADLVLLAQNYNVALLGDELPAGVSADFAVDWALAQTLVPEPTTLALLGLPMAMAARRRRA